MTLTMTKVTFFGSPFRLIYAVINLISMSINKNLFFSLHCRCAWNGRLIAIYDVYSTFIAAVVNKVRYAISITYNKRACDIWPVVINWFVSGAAQWRDQSSWLTMIRNQLICYTDLETIECCLFSVFLRPPAIKILQTFCCTCAFVITVLFFSIWRRSVYKQRNVCIFIAKDV